MNPKEYDFLTDSGVKIIQSTDGYRFTSDAVALANFAKCNEADFVIDAGCGGGVISLIVNDRCKPRKILAVDINAEAALLARKNAALNGMTNIEIRNADIRMLYKESADNLPLANTADMIVCNPPYFSSGRKSTDQTRALARHDDTLTIAELAAAATKLLKYGGTLFLCYPAKYIAKAIYVLEHYNFRVREIQFLQNAKGIYLALIQAKKGGGDSTRVTLSENS